MTDSSLGEVRRVFRAKPLNIVKFAVTGMILLLGTLAWLGSRIQQPPSLLSRDGLIELFVVLAILALGGCVLFHSFQLSRSIVRVCDGGLSIGPESAPELCPWSEVEVVREIFTRARHYLGGGMSYSEPVRRFSVIRSDGRRFHFNEHLYDDVLMLGEYLRGARRDHNLEWEEVVQKSR